MFCFRVRHKIRGGRSTHRQTGAIHLQEEKVSDSNSTAVNIKRMHFISKE